jgi:hypothetical protein
VAALVRGDAPDRPPLYELLRNNEVISCFAGERLTTENAREVVYRAYEPAVDATRPVIRLPEVERTTILPDGRQQRCARWTVWTEHVRYADAEAYAAARRREIDVWTGAWDDERRAGMARWLADVADQQRRLGDVFFFPGAPGIGLMGIIGDPGLESFSLYLADCPDLIDELMEVSTRDAILWIGNLPPDHGITAVFCGDDIAWKSGPLLAPAWFERHYFPRMARICAAYHRAGIRVLFHSDGNLMLVLDGLVEAGIDGLNPIEVLAGMDPGVVHRRYPRLFMAGGIDVSQLLPFGSPQAVRDAVRKALDESEGKLMVGSSTELADAVPLANFLAMRDAVLEYR